MSFPSDLEIARGANLRPLTEIAEEAGIPVEMLEPYGAGAAKISLDAIEALADRPETINADPHGTWLIVVKLSDPGELDALLDAGGYGAHVA